MKCKINDCCNESSVKGLCIKHYKQIYRYGEIRRTVYDPNDIRIHSDYAEIVLRNRRGITTGVTMVDLSDIDELSKYKIYLNQANYAIVNYNNRGVSLNRFLLNPNMGLVVDHINGNTLDNRRSNLRICTFRQNSMNSRPSKNPKKSSIYKGVSLLKKYNTWRAYIVINNKQIHIGIFKTEIQAALAYNEKAKVLFGEFACFNDIKSD